MAAWSRFALSLVVASYLGTLAASLTSTTLGLTQPGWLALLRELGPLLFAPLPCLLVLALVLQARVSVLGLLVFSVTFAALYGVLFVPKASASPHGTALRVLSLNTGASRGMRQPEAIVRTVRALAPDVICLVEAPGDSRATIGASLQDAYPEQVGAASIFVLSRFPLSEARPEVVLSGAKGSLQVTIEVHHRLLTLTAVHLQRVDGYPGLRRGLAPLWRAVQTFSTEERDAAAAELAGLVRKTGGTQILVGDLNFTPTSQAYSVLSGELRDAFLEAGWGVGHTYPTTLRSAGLDLSLPLVRIDYVFHTADLTTTRAWVGPNSGSDHLPIVADLTFR